MTGPLGHYPPPPPPPDGEPIYVPEPYPPQAYANPYQSAPYGYPYQGAAPAAARRRTEPIVGWVLFAVGVLTAVASLLPWAVFFGVSVDGTKGDGTLTALCAIVISATGLIIGLGQGLVWAPITSCVCATLVTITALVDIGNVNRFVGNTADSFSVDAVTVGPGLWLTLIGGLLGIGASAVAMVRRRIL
jgi:hypothetical protein